MIRKGSHSPKLIIHSGHYRVMWLYHCKLEKCCNFFSYGGNLSKMYCNTHPRINGIVIKLELG